jgi:hypothetical protein
VTRVQVIPEHCTKASDLLFHSVSASGTEPMRSGRTLGAMNAIDFDQFVDLLRGRIGAADAVKGSHELHSFRALMADYADVTPEHWYWEAFEELDAQGHLSPTSRVGKGGDAKGRLSADGRLYLDEVDATE